LILTVRDWPLGLVCLADISSPSEKYWERLIPERAFLARVFVDHCVAVKDQKRLEDALPTVSQLAKIINDAWNKLIDLYQSFQDEKLVREFDEVELQDREDELCDQEAEIAEMLKMAVNLDYGDEIGRRQMFPLIRAYLASPYLPLLVIMS
jgi:condensin complex subunit 3